MLMPMHMHMHMHMHTYIHCLHVCVHMCMCMPTYVGIHVCMCMCICMCLCVYMHAHAHAHAHVHAHAHSAGVHAALAALAILTSESEASDSEAGLPPLPVLPSPVLQPPGGCLLPDRKRLPSLSVQKPQLPTVDEAGPLAVHPLAQLQLVHNQVCIPAAVSLLPALVIMTYERTRCTAIYAAAALQWQW